VLSDVVGEKLAGNTLPAEGWGADHFLSSVTNARPQ